MQSKLLEQKAVPPILVKFVMQGVPQQVMAGAWAGLPNQSPRKSFITALGIEFSPPLDGVSLNYEVTTIDAFDATVHFQGADGLMLMFGTHIYGDGPLFLNGFRVWLTGPQATSYTIQYKGYIFELGESEWGTNGNPWIICPQKPSGKCFQCTDEQLRDIYRASYFEAIWIDVGTQPAQPQ